TVYARIGLLAEAEKLARDSLLAAEQRGLSQIVLHGHGRLGQILAHIPGKEEEGRRELLFVLTEGQTKSIPRLEALHRIMLAELELTVGDGESAERHAAMASELAHELPILRGFLFVIQVRARLLLGRPAEALELARQALTILGQLKVIPSMVVV